ncbi:hypothetical protein BLNAU_4916 [Blattamonas nauphoetae]|uniref:Uncharacterized protein n=1 Tax=Blattamonas nauphoetae TaxID=2049346 RepID=A0ABQ9Y8F3_9EUKA|nr:hypothetical protein BLNAU_4916 [Blattamonas nauphoetae]
MSYAPYHVPTLEFVLASPVVWTIAGTLSSPETIWKTYHLLNPINSSLDEWKEKGPEVVEYGQRMVLALFSEGFEETLEQMRMNDKDAQQELPVTRLAHLPPNSSLIVGQCVATILSFPISTFGPTQKHNSFILSK